KYGATDQERDTILRSVLLQSRHMLDLINELLDVTTIESGQLQLKREVVPLEEFLNEAVRRHVELATPKTTRICLETPLGPTDTIFVDPLRLRQVLDNLISNAVKYSPPGSYVCVRAEHQDEEWVISVKDEGPGLKPEDYNLLFQDFAKLSARPTGGEKSTGLGLAISRRVVRAHGGQISAESSPGEGATFWFTIPDPD
ncbi:MAG: HAMP domain-containing histidine kinase, partial [Chloroflexi bacterium]|nr:HAMP domain-containing histidine kinase [Chloroflexota bacterium]